MLIEVFNQRSGEFTLPNAVNVLFQTGEYGVFGFPYIVFIAGGACGDVNCITGIKRK